MPFIKGESLKTAIEKDGPMSVPEVVRVLYHVGEALDYAHEAGVVHRDIKPANILRSGSYALITDFGVAKALNAAMPSQGMTSTGMAIGTPAYMAPEQLAGDSAADHRIDIYAVGLLAYELLNGKSPFHGTTPQRILAAVLTQEPKPLSEARPDVPQKLSDVVMSCLSKEPENRPPTAKDLLQALEMFSNSSGEIRTMEHRVARIVRTPTPTSGITPVVLRDYTASNSERTPTAEVPHVPSLEPTLAVEMQTTPSEAQSVAADSPSDEIDNIGYKAPRKSSTGLQAAVIAVLALVTVGGFVWSQRGSDGVTSAVAPPETVALVDSGSVQPPAAGVTESTTVAVAGVPMVDSQAIRDSLRKVRAEASKKAAAKNDSLRKIQQTPLGAARNAAAAMLADAGARKLFTNGATHMGGVLGKQRRGDLQTQINALVPYLTQAGLGYEHFKLIVQNQGITLFDEFGRMKPDALQQFATGH
jgi:serine/threonine-protein kinase